MNSYADAYHSCYVLAGLSSTQYFNNYSSTAGTGEGGTLDSATHWMSATKDVLVNGATGEELDEEDRLAAIHPIYVIPWGAVDRCHDYFSQKNGF